MIMATRRFSTIVIIPPGARLALSSRLSDSGFRALTKKPVACFEAANLPSGTCFQHRTRPASVFLRNLLRSGGLGDIVHVDLRVS